MTRGISRPSLRSRTAGNRYVLLVLHCKCQIHWNPTALKATGKLIICSCHQGHGFISVFWNGVNLVFAIDLIATEFVSLKFGNFGWKDTGHLENNSCVSSSYSVKCRHDCTILYAQALRTFWSEILFPLVCVFFQCIGTFDVCIEGLIGPVFISRLGSDHCCPHVCKKQVICKNYTASLSWAEL